MGLQSISCSVSGSDICIQFWLISRLRFQGVHPFQPQFWTINSNIFDIGYRRKYEVIDLPYPLHTRYVTHSRTLGNHGNKTKILEGIFLPKISKIFNGRSWKINMTQYILDIFDCIPIYGCVVYEQLSERWRFNEENYFHRNWKCLLAFWPEAIRCRV